MTIQADNIPKRKNKQNQLMQLGKCCFNCEQRELKRFFIEGKDHLLPQITNLSENISVDNHSNIIISTIRSGNTDLLKKVL